MRVLYIKRDYINSYFEKKGWHRFIRQYKSRNLLTGQNGFFEGALYSAFKVTEISWHVLKRLPFRLFKNYDAIVVNQRSSITFDEVKKLFTNFSSVPKILFLSRARVEQMPNNYILDYYDIIFKREPYKDLDLYNKLTVKNKMKIKPTMLGCPFINVKKRQAPNYILNDPDGASFNKNKYDVSFAGRGTSKQRFAVCNAVSGLKHLNYYLSIYNPQKNKIPDYVSPNIKNVRLDMKDYFNLINKTAINLALEGMGQFTHRHLELWYLGAFMLSNPSINNIQLPHCNQAENIHYAVFENNEDLAEKIDYYLVHEDERKKIAAAGQDLFKQVYDFRKHGSYIKECIESL